MGRSPKYLDGQTCILGLLGAALACTTGQKMTQPVEIEAAIETPILRARARWATPEQVQASLQFLDGALAVDRTYTVRTRPAAHAATGDVLTQAGLDPETAVDLSPIASSTLSPIQLGVRRQLGLSTHLPYIVARATLDLCADLKDDKQAAHRMELATELLGDLYGPPLGTIDETNMKAIMATHALEQGQAGQARGLFQRVLESRLAMYVDQHKPEVHPSL